MQPCRSVWKRVMGAREHVRASGIGRGTPPTADNGTLSCTHYSPEFIDLCATFTTLGATFICTIIIPRHRHRDRIRVVEEGRRVEPNNLNASTCTYISFFSFLYTSLSTKVLQLLLTEYKYGCTTTPETMPPLDKGMTMSM